jgi:hypothetical protein
MSEQLSRRSFLIGAAATVAAVGLDPLLRGSTASAAVDPAIPRWSAVHGPTPAANPVVVTGTMVLDIDATVHALTIAPGGTLILHPDKSITLQSRGNVIVNGTLRARPSAPEHVHVMRFIDVDEAAFVGGPTHEPLASDVGLWMTSHTSKAHLDLAGTPKQGWTRLTDAAPAGATVLTVEVAAGWRAGDELVVAPTTSPTVSATHYNQFDRRTIASVNGNTVTLTTPLAFAHPTCTMPNGHVWAAEVCNLTRNVRVEGTSGKRAHIFIHGGTVDAFRHVEVAHMGPRRAVPGTRYTTLVSGRYGLHFHHMGDATRGTVIDGVSLHNLGNRGVVPHASHGMTFTDCIVWDGYDEGYWWDMEVTDDESHNIVYDRCVAGRINTGPPHKAVAGFALAGGIAPVARNCVAFGILGSNRTSGFHWPDRMNFDQNNVWTFEDNLAHNNKVLGGLIWQNDNNAHVVSRFHGYRNGRASLMHGAYGNTYKVVGFESTDCLDADLLLLVNTGAAGAARRQRFEYHGGHIPHVKTGDHRGQPAVPGLFLGVAIERITEAEPAAVLVPGWYDFVDCGLTPTDVVISKMHRKSVLRIQTGDQAWRISAAGVESIKVFA